MTVKTKLLGTTAFCLTIAFVVAWALGATSRRVNDAVDQNTRAGEIVQGVFELSGRSHTSAVVGLTCWPTGARTETLSCSRRFMSPPTSPTASERRTT